MQIDIANRRQSWVDGKPITETLQSNLKPMSWLCNCGLVNGSLNESCPGALSNYKHEHHKQVSANTPDWLQAYVIARELGMTPQEELFAKFYNHEKVLVKDMDLVQLREHREELSKIAFEAKARLVASDDEARERKAKVNNKEWLVTDTQPNQNVSDAINAVKIRATRMSKIDKMREQLTRAGIDEETIKEMLSNLERTATNKNLKTITFNKPSVEVSAVRVQSQANNEPKEPFNPTALKFGS